MPDWRDTIPSGAPSECYGTIEPTCPECDGTGEIEYYRPLARVCQRCYGSNKDPDGGCCKRCACLRCEGTGRVNDERKTA